MRGILTKLAPFLVLLPFLPAAAGAEESERAEIIRTFADVRPSVGALYAQEEDGDMRFLCSATAVDRRGPDTVIMTAYHCVQKGVSYLINFGDNKLRTARVWKIPHYEVDKEKHPRKFNEPKTDMALFLMEGNDVPVVPLSKSSRADLGSKVVMIGYPLGVAKISYEGIVAGRFDRVGSDNYNYVLLQIFGAPGSSGSSVVSVETGKIIGILVSAKEERGLPVLFATPIEYMKHLMDVRPKNGEE